MEVKTNRELGRKNEDELRSNENELSTKQD
jgi:hypothetical protein